MTEGAELQWLPQSVEVCRKRLPDFRKVTVNRLCGERSKNVVSVGRVSGVVHKQVLLKLSFPRTRFMADL